MSPLFWIILAAAGLALIGLIIYARRSKPVQESTGDVQARSEELVSLAGLEGDCLIAENGDLIVMLEFKPLQGHSSIGAAGLGAAFARVVASLEENLCIQICSIPQPQPAERFIRATLRQRRTWEEKEQKAVLQRNHERAELCAVYQEICLRQADQIYQQANHALYRQSLVVVRSPGRQLGGDLSDAIQEMSLKADMVRSLFDNQRIFLNPLSAQEALNSIWNLYHPDRGACEVQAGSLARAMEISLGKEMQTPVQEAISLEDVQAIVESPEKLKSLLAPRVFQEAPDHLLLGDKALLLWYVYDYRASIPSIDQLYGRGGEFAERLYISYYLGTPSAAELARRTRQESTMKQAVQEIGQRYGSLPSYKQSDEIMAIEETRMQAEMDQRLPRSLGLYLGLLVETDQIEEYRSRYESVLTGLHLRYLPARFNAREFWKNLLPLNDRRHQFTDRNIQSENIAPLLPLSFEPLWQEGGEFLGFQPFGRSLYPVALRKGRGEQLVGADAVIGTVNSGKSFFLKNKIVEWVTAGHKVIAIDPKSEIIPLTRLLGGAQVNFLGEKGINLLRFDQIPTRGRPNLEFQAARQIFLHNLDTLKAFYGFFKGEGQNVEALEANLLESALKAAMERKGLDWKDGSTWQPNAVMLVDVYQELVQMKTQTRYANLHLDLILGNLQSAGHPDGIYYADFNTSSKLDFSRDLVSLTMGARSYLGDFNLRKFINLYIIRAAAQYALRAFLAADQDALQPIHIVIDEASQLLDDRRIASAVVRMLSVFSAYGVQFHLAFQDAQALLNIDALERGSGGESGNTLGGVISSYWLFKQKPRSIEAARRLLDLSDEECRLIGSQGIGSCYFVSPGTPYRFPLRILADPDLETYFQSDPETLKAVQLALEEEE